MRTLKYLEFLWLKTAYILSIITTDVKGLKPFMESICQN